METVSEIMVIVFDNSYMHLGVDDICCSVIFRPFKHEGE